MTRFRTRCTLVLGAVAASALLAPSAGAQDDPALDQTIAADQAVVDGPVELTAGHIDVGPRFVDGRWEVLVHDATVQPSVWRRPSDVVFRVSDGARMSAPDDPAYAFLGVAAGDPVWVVPQTELAGVVWLGWNTQDPEVMERIDRGVSLRLLGVDGPGSVSVYLQSGNLSGPQVLWEPDVVPEPVWVDVNTHTHANWAFTAPGVHLLRLEIAADLRDGSTVADEVDLRVAVGDAASADDAFAATFDPSSLVAPSAAAESSSRPAPPVAEADGGVSGVLIGVVVLGGVLVATAVGMSVVRTRSARRAAVGASPWS